MSAGGWLAEREPKPPAELFAAITAAVSHTDDRTAARKNDRSGGGLVSDQLIIAAERLLPRVVFSGCEQRSGALDLLTLDALLTYAMEASSDNRAHCEETATALLDAIGTTLGSV